MTKSRFALSSSQDSALLYNLLRTIFLALMLTGYAFYPMDLWILGHWLESWQSRIPFIVAAPSVIFTVLMLIWWRVNAVRYPFIFLMILNVLTGLAGATYHLLYNFEGEVIWSLAGLTQAFEGSRPVLAALSFTHIGVTGLLCSFVTKPQESQGENV
jgi:hypothetical protein